MTVPDIDPALRGGIDGLTQVVNAAKDGAPLTDNDPALVLEYDAVATQYAESVLQILRDPDVARIMQGHIHLMNDPREAISAHLRIEAAREGKAPAVILRAYGNGVYANRLGALFPNSQWTKIDRQFDYAEKELEASDMVGPQGANWLLDSLIVGLDKRIKAVKTNRTVWRTGEETDAGLRKRIEALQKANELLVPTVAKTKPQTEK